MRGRQPLYYFSITRQRAKSKAIYGTFDALLMSDDIGKP